MGKRHLKRRESKGSDFKSSRILYVVLFTIAVQFFYPISVDVNGTPVEWRQFLYQLFYMSFFVAGIFLAACESASDGNFDSDGGIMGGFECWIACFSTG